MSIQVRQPWPELLIIRFSDPGARNPLSIDIQKELHLIIDNLSSDPIVKTLVFRGADDVFASGADLREIAALDQGRAREFSERGQMLMDKIAKLQKKTVAAVNGYCLGGGLDMALACDIRIASRNASFGHPGARLGIVTGWGGTQRLPRLIGQANALELFFTAEPIGAQRAFDIGLVDLIADDILDSDVVGIRSVIEDL